MSTARYTAGRLVKATGMRSLDATFTAVGGGLRSLTEAGFSLIQGKEQRGWVVGLDGTAHRMLDPSPATLLGQMSLNEVVYACMRARMSALIQPAFVVERKQPDGTYIVDDTHELTALFRRPGPNLDTASLWRCFEASYSSIGKLYIEPMYAGGLLAGLNPLNPLYVKEQYDEGLLTGYLWQPPAGRTVTFGVDDLITRRAVEWADVPPLIAALGAVEADQVSNDFLRGFFGGSGVPTGIIKTRDEWDEDTIGAFRKAWIRLFGPAREAQGSPAILNPSITDYEKIGANLDEVDNETIRMFIETRICMPFGVPPLIIYAYAGLLKATYSNLQEAWASFWESTAMELLSSWADWINWSILIRYESRDAILLGNVRCRFDPAGLGPYQEDVNAKIAQYREGWDTGAVKLNELRAVMGLPPEPDGDVFKTDRQPEPAVLEIPAREGVPNG